MPPKRTTDTASAQQDSSKRRATAAAPADADTTVVVNEHLLHQAGGHGAQMVSLEDDIAAHKDAEDEDTQLGLKTPDKTTHSAGGVTPATAGSSSSGGRSAARLLALPDTTSGKATYKVAGPTELTVVAPLQSKVDDKNFTFLTGSVKDTTSGKSCAPSVQLDTSQSFHAFSLHASLFVFLAGTVVGLNVKGKAVALMKDLRVGAVFQVTNAKLVNNSSPGAPPNYTLDPDNFGQGNVKIFRKERFDGIPLSTVAQKVNDPPNESTPINSTLGVLFQYRMLDNGDVQYLLINRTVTDPVIVQSRYPKPEYNNNSKTEEANLYMLQTCLVIQIN